MRSFITLLCTKTNIVISHFSEIIRLTYYYHDHCYYYTQSPRYLKDTTSIIPYPLRPAGMVEPIA
jgi:hypothetical protein